MRRYEAVINEFEKYRKLSGAEKRSVIQKILGRHFMDLRCDWAFKHVMQDPEILKMLLNDILPEQVAGIRHLPNEIDRFFEGDKDATMDVLCVADDGREFIVEFQQQRKRTFRERMFYYGASMVHAQVPRGASYARMRPVYVIVFTDFAEKHLDEGPLYRYSMREDLSGEAYGAPLHIYLCELPRLHEKAPQEMSPLECWLFIFKNLYTFAEEPEGIGERYARVFAAARMHALPSGEQQQYLRAMVSDEEREDIEGAAYDYGFEIGVEQGHKEGVAEGMAAGIEQGIKTGIEQGKAEGREEGRTEATLASARKMKALGADVSFICEVTGLLPEQVAAL